MSDSVQPQRWQPTGLPHPWDSPGKNTGVGCHFLLQCMKVRSESEVAQSCLALLDPWTTAYQAPPSMGFSRQEYWSFSFIIPSKEIPGLISFRMDWLDLLEVQGTLKSLLQHHSSKAIGIHISPPFRISFPSPSPSYPSRLIQSPCLGFLRHRANSYWLSILYMVM